jgi:hypothetical protein
LNTLKYFRYEPALDYNVLRVIAGPSLPDTTLRNNVLSLPHDTFDGTIVHRQWNWTKVTEVKLEERQIAFKAMMSFDAIKHIQATEPRVIFTFVA